MQTRFLPTLRLTALVCVCIALVGCNSSDDDPVIGVSNPGAPTNLTANVGTTAISLGWDAPTDTGGSAIQTYEVQVTPTISSANILVSGTRALLSNLTTGTTYSVSVRARSGAGTGAAASKTNLTTQSVTSGSYQQVSIAGNPGPSSGIFDPSILRASNGDLWMSYSAVHYYNNGSNQLVQDVGVRLARSTDNGATFNYVSTIVSPYDVTLGICGEATCVGRWVYETSWLIDDSTDPVASRRYKLFAHKYFLRPASTPATFYHLGAIVMWTAGSLTGPWSTETSLLGWDTTPIELLPLRNVNALHSELDECLVVSEGSASVRGDTIDFAFACPYAATGGNLQKIVMLRSTDHASTFQYVSTLLSASDATPIGANYFSAPSLLASAGSAPVLIATPVYSGRYGGCVVIPIADDTAGTLFRSNNLPIGILYTPPQNSVTPNTISGACAYERSLGSRGILQSNTIAGAVPFAIHATGAVLQP